MSSFELDDMPVVLSGGSATNLNEEKRGFDGEMKDVNAYILTDIADETISYSDSPQGLSAKDIQRAIETMVTEYGDDPNFPSRVLEKARCYLYDADVKADRFEYTRLYEELKTEAELMVLNSPYPEVRAIVDDGDDPDMPTNTFRVWFIGLLFVVVGSFIDQLFSIRLPGIGVGSNVAQLLAYPAGKFLERVLPSTQFRTFGRAWSFNPGPFNLKEHMLITIMAGVGFSGPYTIEIVWVQYLDMFFGQHWAINYGYQLLIGLSTNFIGYGLAGLTRRFLVYPARAYWPGSVAIIAMNRIFHHQTNDPANGWRISRFRYFMYCFIAMFVYFWFPGYIFQALSFFNWITWINPESINLAAVTGSFLGMGLNPFPTFDWSHLGLDPIVIPFYSNLNSFLGGLVSLPIILAIWYKNIWNTAYLPINSNLVFDNTASLYNVSLVVNEDSLFDATAYEQYSPAYLAASTIIVYGFFFATYTATLTHALLHNRREIARAFRGLFNRQPLLEIHDDAHSRAMRAYKEVPEWVYFCVLVLSIALGAAGIGAFPTHTSPAVVFYGIALAAVFCVPIGIISATTGVEVPLNVLAEFLAGTWFPGNATAMNFFKSYGVSTTGQAIGFAFDLKLAHYAHIPPRMTFAVQMVATAVSTFVTIGVLNFQMTSIPDVCSRMQKDHFTCPAENTFFTASVLWGTLGPKRMFGAHAIYDNVLWFFLVGFLLPIPFFFLGKKYNAFKNFHVPVFLSGGLIWGAGNMSYIWPAIPLAFFFNRIIKKRYFGWWGKYAYLTATAFSCGISVAGIVIFFALQWRDVQINWSGNLRPFAGLDYRGFTLLPIPDQGFFGPGPGEF